MKPTKKTVKKKAKRKKGLQPAKGKVIKLYTMQEETVSYLEKEFPNEENGRAVDEIVRRYKLMKGI